MKRKIPEEELASGGGRNKQRKVDVLRSGAAGPAHAATEEVAQSLWILLNKEALLCPSCINIHCTPTPTIMDMILQLLSPSSAWFTSLRNLELCFDPGRHLRLYLGLYLSKQHSTMQHSFVLVLRAASQLPGLRRLVLYTDMYPGLLPSFTLPVRLFQQLSILHML